MKRFLILLVLVVFISLTFSNIAWASHTEHTLSGNWEYNDEVDSFSYVYCDLSLPVDNRVGSLTQVTLTITCTERNLNSYDIWNLEIYRAGSWKGISGANPRGTLLTTVSGGYQNRSKTLTINVPDDGSNGLGFNAWVRDTYHSETDDECNFDITVTKIKYRIYSVDGFEPVVTYDRYVLFSVIQDTPVTNMRYIVTRTPRDVSRSTNEYSQGTEDMNVDPEKYYHYYLYYGFHMDDPTGSYIEKTVKNT